MKRELSQFDDKQNFVRDFWELGWNSRMEVITSADIDFVSNQYPNSLLGNLSVDR